MIERQIAYRVICDGCGCEIEADSYYTPLYLGRLEAKEAIKDNDWKMKNKKTYCPDCDIPKTKKP